MERPANTTVAQTPDLVPGDVLLASRRRGDSFQHWNVVGMTIVSIDCGESDGSRGAVVSFAASSTRGYVRFVADWEWAVEVRKPVGAKRPPDSLSVQLGSDARRATDLEAQRAAAPPPEDTDLTPTIIVPTPPDPLDVFVDDLTVRALFAIYHDREEHTLSGFTPAQREAFSVEWSRQLREKQKAAREAERNRVVVDWGDDE